MNFKYIILFLGLFYSNVFFGQAYVKFHNIPTEIKQKSAFVQGLKIKYNLPKKGFMYVSLLRNDIAIGNAVVPVKRGKRIVDCNITVWEEKNLKKKGDYKYRINVWEGAKDTFSERMVDPIEFSSITVVN